MSDYSIDSAYVRQFDEELQSFISSGIEGAEEDIFNKLALKEFSIQYNNIDYYRNFCNARGITPENCRSWSDIPALPSSAFKETVIAAFPLHQTEQSIMTSGTSNPNSPSKIYRDKRGAELLLLANSIMTRKYLFPDVEKMKILLMVPSPKLAPAMGMAVGLEQMRQNFGTADSTYLITPNGMEWELLFDALHEAEETGVPVAIIGATSGLVFFYNFCREQGLKFKLPPESRICDGGGYLGTFGECSRDEYLSLCEDVLGVPKEYCVNTLGSGECATNYFDNVLANHLPSEKAVPRYKESPSWTRTIAIDPETGQRLAKGKIGLLRHYDLVNRANVFAVQTGNLGYEIEDGFEILGRADAIGKADSTVLNRMIKGDAACSTVAVNMLQGSGSCATAANDMLAQPCSTVATEMLSTSCSTVATDMLNTSCSTVANEMLSPTCSTVATEMLTPTCSTVATDMLATSCSTVATEMLSPTCSTVSTEMLTPTCSTVASEMLSAGCSTVANNMLNPGCSTAADQMLAPSDGTCSTAADELLANSPHGNMFHGIPRERLEKLKKYCPFLRLQGLMQKDKIS